MPTRDTSRAWASALTRKGAVRVPEITVFFWAAKILSTAFGESTSDSLVNGLGPAFAVALGFLAFGVALVFQFRMQRYSPVTYWFAVAMVGVFGTMAADVLHVGFHVPYIASSVVYAVGLAGVFLAWQSTEGTLSIHSIETPRREIFYWLAVVATFAMGTALGDLTAITFQLGYGWSIVLFAVVMCVPAIGLWRFNWNPVLAFWFAYVVTRPLGASVADWIGKPAILGGLGLGSGNVALLLAGGLTGLVAYLAITGRDVQTDVRVAGPAVAVGHSLDRG